MMIYNNIVIVITNKNKGVCMAIDVYFGSFSKRRNSTKVPDTSGFTKKTLTLKETTSIDAPTFVLSGDHFDWNYAKWGTRYYFITDIRSVHNGLTEIDCIIDVLATYKTEIKASTQFVSYSSEKTSDWLADTRIPVQKNATVSKNVTTMNFLFNTTGFYVISVIGKKGCETWCLDQSGIDQLIDRLTDWSDDLVDDVFNGNYPWSNPPRTAVTYDFANAPEESLAKMNALIGLCGNAYSDAPNCIRSCIWVPFFATFFAGSSDEIYLGQFPTGVTAYRCNTTPAVRSASVNIPWQYSDFRRSTCEEIYLYLPLVGMISVPSDEIINESSISVEWSATATDGCIAYRLTAGNQVIGTYGANASANFAIGISQQQSAGAIVQTTIPAISKTLSAGVKAAAKGPGAATLGALKEGIIQGYNVMDTVLTRHNSCIGGIGGGAGVGLSLDLSCISVAHPTVIAPADMKDTMGLPTMKPMSLSTLTGYCECANAHVDAAAMAVELEMIDNYLNSGFYIE